MESFEGAAAPAGTLLRRLCGGLVSAGGLGEIFNSFALVMRCLFSLFVLVSVFLLSFERMIKH